jgi:hypothetical protein
LDTGLREVFNKDYYHDGQTVKLADLSVLSQGYQLNLLYSNEIPVCHTIITMAMNQ